MKKKALTTEEKKLLALATYLGVDADEITENDPEFTYGRREYLVLTDSEADEKAKEYITDSLWAFNPSFLSGETGIDQEVFEAIQKNERCEDNNPAILSIVKATCGIDSLVESAISTDGRGHFLSRYDGNEEDLGDFYIYRTN